MIGERNIIWPEVLVDPELELVALPPSESSLDWGGGGDVGGDDGWDWGDGGDMVEIGDDNDDDMDVDMGDGMDDDMRGDMDYDDDEYVDLGDDEYVDLGDAGSGLIPWDW